MSNKKRLIRLAVLILLVIAIPLTMYLIRQQQILRSRADFVAALSFTGPNVQTSSGQTIATNRNVSLQLSYVITTPTPTRTPTPTPTPTPTAPPPSTFKRVFVTSTTYDGNLGGFTGADQKCQSLANAVPSLAGSTWKAWLSRNQTSAASRINPTNNQSLGPFQLLDGRIVAANWTDLTDGSIQNPINLTETQTTVDQNNNAGVWTHTLPNGSPQTVQTISSPNPPFPTACAQTVLTTTTTAWSSNLLQVTGGIGSAVNSDGQWTNILIPGFTMIGCNNEARLYCFEVGTSGTPGQVGGGTIPTPTPSSGALPITYCTGGIQCDSQCLSSGGLVCGPSGGYKNCRYTSGSINCTERAAPIQRCQIIACAPLP